MRIEMRQPKDRKLRESTVRLQLGRWEQYARERAHARDRETWLADCFAVNALSQILGEPMDAMERIPFEPGPPPETSVRDFLVAIRDGKIRTRQPMVGAA